MTSQQQMEPVLVILSVDATLKPWEMKAAHAIQTVHQFMMVKSVLVILFVPATRFVHVTPSVRVTRRVAVAAVAIATLIITPINFLNGG